VKRKKKTDRQKLIDKLDKVFSLYIRARDKYICFTCGINKEVAELRRMSMQAGHLFSCTNYSTRWDELNTHCQCSGCNMSHEYNPHPYVVAFIKKYGAEAYAALNLRHNATLKLHNSEIEILINHYQVLLDNLTSSSETNTIRKED
jgi:hypothetical protein